MQLTFAPNIQDSGEKNNLIMENLEKGFLVILSPSFLILRDFVFITRFSEHDFITMDPENLALAQEEATLTKIRNYLNLQKVKLWEAPYYDTEKKIPCDVRYICLEVK